PLLHYHTPSPTQIPPLSLHDALPILRSRHRHFHRRSLQESQVEQRIDHHTRAAGKNLALLEAKIFLVKVTELFRLRRNKCDVSEDRKSTRLNSSHVSISYAVFCLKKK